YPGDQPGSERALRQPAKPGWRRVHSQKAVFPAGLRQPGERRVPALDFFVFSYFRVFVIHLEELPWAMTSSRFPRENQLQRLDTCPEANCVGMRSNRARKHESTK